MEENTAYDTASIEASAIASGRRLNCSDGSVIIKGIRLPAMVVSQLEALGAPLEMYSVGQLEDAIRAVEEDGTLIDDDEGITFEDKLQLTDEERRERAERKAAFRIRNQTLYTHLFADVRDASCDQLYNPWCAPRVVDFGQCDVADDFEIVHFGHEHLCENMPPLAMSHQAQHDWMCDRDGYPILQHFFE